MYKEEVISLQLVDKKCDTIGATNFGRFPRINPSAREKSDRWSTNGRSISGGWRYSRAAGSRRETLVG